MRSRPLLLGSMWAFVFLNGLYRAQRLLGLAWALVLLVGIVVAIPLTVWWAQGRRRRLHDRSSRGGHPTWNATVDLAATPWAEQTPRAFFPQVENLSALVAIEPGRLMFRPSKFSRLGGFTEWELPLDGVHSLKSESTRPHQGARHLLPSRDRVTIALPDPEHTAAITLVLDDGPKFIAALQSSRDKGAATHDVRRVE